MEKGVLVERKRHQRVHFRPLRLDDDLPRLKVWLEDPDVSPWYSDGETTLENLRDKYAPEPSTQKYLFEIDEIPAGYLQTYQLGDEPEYAAQIAIETDAGCIDLFIGEAQFRNCGWGTSILIAALDRLIFGQMACDMAMIAPSPSNTRAVRCYEHAGYRQIKTVFVSADEPENTGYELVMLQSREEFRQRFRT